MQFFYDLELSSENGLKMFSSTNSILLNNFGTF